MDKNVKVLILNDCKISGAGIRGLLNREPIFDVELITCGTQVSEEINQVKYDVCLIDFKILERSSIKLITEISCVQPDIKIMISGKEDFTLYFNTFIDKDVCGFINYSYSQEQMVLAIKNVISGLAIIPLSLLRTLRRTKNEVNIGDGRVVSLSEVQEDILDKVSKGSTNDEIAEAFYMSRRNVERHLTTVYRELNVKSRTEAVQFAREWGLISQKML